MQEKLDQLIAVLKLTRPKFNQISTHRYHSFDDLLNDIDILSASLSQRTKYSFDHFDLLVNNDLRNLTNRRGESNRDQKAEFGHLRMTIDGNEACIQAVNMAVDGIYFNISSALDIFAKIAIVLLYPPARRPNLNKLGEYCDNSTNSPTGLERLVMSKFVPHRSRNTRPPAIINDVRGFRNIITHELVFFPAKGVVKWVTEGPLGPIKPYLQVDPDVFPSLPVLADGRFVGYTEQALLEVSEFLDGAVRELTVLVGNAQQIPVH